MIRKPYLGMSWARVKIIAKVTKDREFDFGNGCGEILKNQAAWVIQCACGKKFEMWCREWKGVRAIKDCGCGVSDKDGRSILRNFLIPELLDSQIKAHAAKYTNGNYSRAAVELLRGRLDELDNESNKDISDIPA